MLQYQRLILMLEEHGMSSADCQRVLTRLRLQIVDGKKTDLWMFNQGGIV